MWVMKVIPTKLYDIIVNTLPMIVLFSLVMILYRIICVIITKEKTNGFKELKMLIYIIYCFLLFKLVTTTDFESYSNNFMPFKEIMRYKITSVLFYRNVVGNILLFLPFGFLITDMIHDKTSKINFFISTFMVFITSLSIEIIQMHIGRSFDIDDIILNVVGGILGFIIFYIINKIKNKWIQDKSSILPTILSFIIFILILILIILMVVKYI